MEWQILLVTVMLTLSRYLKRNDLLGCLNLFIYFFFFIWFPSYALLKIFGLICTCTFPLLYLIPLYAMFYLLYCMNVLIFRCFVQRKLLPRQGTSLTVISLVICGLHLITD